MSARVSVNFENDFMTRTGLTDAGRARARGAWAQDVATSYDVDGCRGANGSAIRGLVQAKARGGGTGGAARSEVGVSWSLCDHGQDADERSCGAVVAGANTRRIFPRDLPGAPGVLLAEASCFFASWTATQTPHMPSTLKVFCTAFVNDIDCE